ncbi:Mss4-like protein [Microdochium trichocladiopsis]|uniref:Translationally-controlled tumor protein homolog n=1 Tax=Microdochium trichocladiopsis TaxID=1682393 RepID=A0A9P9BUI7_9PEZI|nr:Mss4-like protein [Microdochium trichocladiopsis]KAH7037676.1 Mss4-like protein [Microdochium trichocladiopsis]
MIIYKDAVLEVLGNTGDELISDSFDVKEVDGVAYEADCAMIEIGAVDVDTGANASAEEAEEGVEDSAEKVNNIVHSFRLQPTSFDKKSYLVYLKEYMGNVKKALAAKGATEEEVKDFQSKANAFAKKIIANFKDYEFYIGESMNPDGMVVLLNYREDGVTPYVTLWKHGLTEMKV